MALQQEKIIYFLLIWIIVWPVSLVIINNWPESEISIVPQEQASGAGDITNQNAVDFRSLSSEYGAISVVCTDQEKLVDVVFHRKSLPRSLEKTIKQLCDEQDDIAIDDSLSLAQRLNSVKTYQLQSVHTGQMIRFDPKVLQKEQYKLIAYPVLEIEKRSITFLTGLSDWNPDKDYQAKQLDWIEHLGKMGLPLRILAPNKYQSRLSSSLSGQQSISLIPFDESDIKAFPLYSQIESVRKSEDWKRWVKLLPDLSKSPKISSHLYFAFAMQKIEQLEKLCKDDPFGTEYFVWIEPDECSLLLKPEIKNTFVTQLEELLKPTGFGGVSVPYEITTDLQGINAKTALSLSGTSISRLFKSTLYGGTCSKISTLKGRFLNVLKLSLDQKELGSDEALWTILFHNYPVEFRDLQISPEPCAAFR